MTPITIDAGPIVAFALVIAAIAAILFWRRR